MQLSEWFLCTSLSPKLDTQWFILTHGERLRAVLPQCASSFRLIQSKQESTFVYEMSHTSLIDRLNSQGIWGLLQGVFINSRCLTLSVKTGRKMFLLMVQILKPLDEGFGFAISFSLWKSVAFWISLGWQLYSEMEGVTPALLGLHGWNLNTNCSDPHSFQESPFSPHSADGLEREKALQALGDIASTKMTGTIGGTWPLQLFLYEHLSSFCFQLSALEQILRKTQDCKSLLVCWDC